MKGSHVLLLGVLLILGTFGCTRPAPTPIPPPTVTATATVTVPAPTPKPKGSVLEYKGDYQNEQIEEGYWRLQVVARVQNLGDSGTITVFAQVRPQDQVYQGRNSTSTEVYLRQGEEKQLVFRFWVKWPNEGLEYLVVTAP
ncbi:MAG: hypothetical protein HY530_06090 [Chloroflexi bacterium]|nr:hypothetical protein [Chloroflexota bacterium]